MSPSIAKRAFFKTRAAINLTNAAVLSRLNGSLVVSGYPKTGTTYLSHLAEAATGKQYIEGSMHFAIRPSVIHTHSRNIPSDSVYSYRPVDTVIASLVLQRLQEADTSFADRLRVGGVQNGDAELIQRTATGLLRGSLRLPPPSQYYRAVRQQGATIVNILDLRDEDGAARHSLTKAWNISAERLSAAIEQAARLSEKRRTQGHEFYNRPTERVSEILQSDEALGSRIAEEAELTRRIVEEAANG